MYNDNRMIQERGREGEVLCRRPKRFDMWVWPVPIRSADPSILAEGGKKRKGGDRCNMPCVTLARPDAFSYWIAAPGEAMRRSINVLNQHRRRSNEAGRSGSCVSVVLESAMLWPPSYSCPKNCPVVITTQMDHKSSRVFHDLYWELFNFWQHIQFRRKRNVHAGVVRFLSLLPFL